MERSTGRLATRARRGVRRKSQTCKHVTVKCGDCRGQCLAEEARGPTGGKTVNRIARALGLSQTEQASNSCLCRGALSTRRSQPLLPPFPPSFPPSFLPSSLPSFVLRPSPHRLPPFPGGQQAGSRGNGEKGRMRHRGPARRSLKRPPQKTGRCGGSWGLRLNVLGIHPRARGVCGGGDQSRNEWSLRRCLAAASGLEL